jgi:hypothetical protein
MRIFHRLVFDGYVNGTANVYSDPTLSTLLGSIDQLAIGGYTTQVSGSGPPTVTVQVEHSFDNIRWQNRNTAAEVNASTLSTTAETPFGGNDGDPTLRPRLEFVRLRIALGGTSPTGQVRVWVTGHDEGEG